MKYCMCFSFMNAFFSLYSEAPHAWIIPSESKAVTTWWITKIIFKNSSTDRQLKVLDIAVRKRNGKVSDFASPLEMRELSLLSRRGCFRTERCQESSWFDKKKRLRWKLSAFEPFVSRTDILQLWNGHKSGWLSLICGKRRKERLTKRVFWDKIAAI